MLGNKFGCGRKGIKLSDETKKKISDSHKGKKFSKLHINNIAESRKGKIQSEETKKKISDKMKMVWKKRKH
jgi:hypothetical protein